jgi:NAD(P)-dependent dehydrogenase (short-subunit alcohol dehydrogenase family)
MRFVLITGVSTGIGYECTRDLVQLGYHVFGNVRRQEDADKLQKEFGSACTPLIFDVTDNRQIAAAVPVVREKIGSQGLYALVNNAGIAVVGPLNTIALDQLRYQFEVNLFGALAVIQYFLPFLGADIKSPYPPGRIINISSTSGGKAYPFMGPYSASKHALEALSTALRREMILYGIKVIVIRPASTWTPIWQKAPELAAYQLNDYYPSLKRMRDHLVNGSRGDMMPVTRVSRVIVKALTSDHPRTHYVVTRSRIKNWIMFQILPAPILDKIIARKLGFGQIISAQVSGPAGNGPDRPSSAG